MNWKAYIRLMRLHQPIGILLLWWPTAWALWIANANHPPGYLILLFFIGTILMRSAGCVVNDMSDKALDIHVQRTKNRPLASGVITLKQAMFLLLILLSGALIILLLLPWRCWPYALIALIISLLYPFCKRFIEAPQLVLGLAFSMGIPIAYAASGVAFNVQTAYLFLLNFIWIIAYDTEYAMADEADDRIIGVKSSAILFSPYAQRIIAFLQLIVHLFWFLILPISDAFLIAWVFAGLIFVYQHRLLVHDKEKYAIRAFRSNNFYGWSMWLGIVFSLK